MGKNYEDLLCHTGFSVDVLRAIGVFKIPSLGPLGYGELSRDGIFKLLRSPGIDPKDSIPPAYVAWRAGTTTLLLLGS
jgi:hypothetical protein